VIAFVRATLLLLMAAPAAYAQDVDGHFSTLFDVMPDVSPEGGRQPIAELRTRLFAEALFNAGDAWHARAGLFADGLVADRGVLGGTGVSAAAIVRPADAYMEFRGTTFDVRAGMSRIVWGRLDEFQPTDVVNPLDLSRFVFEGRSEARLPIALVRGRVFLPRSSTLEGIVAPVFRRGRFDQLEEDTSPFRLSPPGEIERDEPGTSWSNLQGGARLASTTGRVDWAVSAWRGFEHFPTYVPALARVEGAPRYLAVFPRFTMVGVDFETVRGPWGLRGELAWFGGVSPRSFEGGIGADRRAGNYRVALNAVASRAEDTDVSLVAYGERTFARETRSVRLLAVYDPADDTAFIRGIGSWSIRDNVSVEGSAGFITGSAGAGAQSGVDVLALLSGRDFLYVRLKVHFCRLSPFAPTT
jgi:hypothetical protein